MSLEPLTNCVQISLVWGTWARSIKLWAHSFLGFSELPPPSVQSQVLQAIEQIMCLLQSIIRRLICWIRRLGVQTQWYCVLPTDFQVQLWMLQACTAARNDTSLLVRPEARRTCCTTCDGLSPLAARFPAGSKPGVASSSQSAAVFPWPQGELQVCGCAVPQTLPLCQSRSLASEALQAFFHQEGSDAFQKDLADAGNFTGMGLEAPPGNSG